jgi:hypothetical protein
MRNILTALLAVTVLGLLVIGCSSDQNPVTPDGKQIQFDRTRMTASQATTVTSAMFCVRAEEEHDATIYVHRITADWDEYTVSWDSFGGAYDPTPVTSELIDDIGYHCFDVTSLVQDWYDGTYPDYGLLLDEQGTPEGRTRYRTRESLEVPYLVVCFEGGECDTLICIADTYIWENHPADNSGSETISYTGYNSDLTYEKQALFRFSQAPCTSALGDFVWHDLNHDGIQDEGEPGFEGVTVNLYDCDDNPLGSTTTDADGHYWFSGLSTGSYYVEFIAPQGYLFSPRNQGGDDAMDSDADPTYGTTPCTPLECEENPTLDAGLYMPEEEGCTRTIGFWKNWSGFGPQPDMVSPLLPIWLGEAGGAKSIAVTTNQIAYNLLTQHVYGHPSNGITKLYAQLLAAKLNIAFGASDDAVDDAIDDADEFLADYDWHDWDNFSKQEQKKINKLKSLFDKYNNGIIGPGHCDDFGDEDDD